MSDRIEGAFRKGKAFIPFVTAGDPDIETTVRLAIGMAAAGADLIELGVPFSDPVAEGPVIQRSSERALRSGTTAEKVFAAVRKIRGETDVPIALMTYFNPVFAYGAEKFTACCRDCGVDALIVPDLPFEERGEIKPFCDKHGVKLISMVAPTSGARISAIAGQAEGFLYIVSSLGVTGVRPEIVTDLGELVAHVKAAKDIPCAVGFGIARPDQARKVASVADGVIVGSAIVSLVEQHGHESVGPVCEYVAAMKSAVSEAV